MWYYELNRKAFGPVNQETVIDELNAGRITRMTLVWRQGWPQWKCLGETELAALSGSTPPPVVIAAPPPVFVPGQKAINAKSSTLSKLFWWWFGLNFFTLPYQFAIYFAFADVTAPNFTLFGLAFLAWFPLCAGSVIHYILIYKLWKVVQDGHARTTPGQAVGFMFIPYFNYYWFYQAYYGLAKDLNAYIDRHFVFLNPGQVRKAHPKLVLSYVISMWASVLASLAIVMFFYMKTMITVLSGGRPETSLMGLMVPALIMSALLFVFQIVVYFDLFLTAKSILKNEQVLIR